jgi:hypothetical protein
MNLVRDRWMFVPVVFLGLSVTTAVTTVTLAVAGRPIGAEPDYYEKAIAWDRHREQTATNDRLRWTVSPVFSSTEDGSPKLTLSVNDKYGNSIDASSLSLEAIPVKNADRRETLEARRIAPGTFETTLAQRLAGQWEFRVTVVAEKGTYTDSFRRTLSFGAGGTAAARGPEGAAHAR